MNSCVDCFVLLLAAHQYGNTVPYDHLDPGLCEDHEPKLCKDWARTGECQHNPKFMVGDIGSAGHCPKSCGTCTPCDKGDRECYNSNRRKAGYLVYNDLDSDDL